MSPVRFLIPFALLAAASAPLFAQVAASAPVIEAGSFQMSRSEFEGLVDGQPSYRAAMSQPAGRKALGDKLGKAFALEAEARLRKLDQDPKFKLQLRAYTLQALAARLLDDLRAAYLKDEPKLKAVYEQRKQEFSQPRVRHILIRPQGSPVPLRPGVRELTVAEAQAKAESLRAKLAAGADFATLARAESDDPSGSAKGGDLGLIRRGTLDAEFEAAAYQLPVGQISAVVRTSLGFHILKVDERLPEPFDSVRNTLANDLAHKDMETIALKGYKLDSAYFGQ